MSFSIRICLNNHRALLTILFFLLVCSLSTISAHGVHGHPKHGKSHNKTRKTIFTPYVSLIKQQLQDSLSGFDKQQQSYISAFIVSTPSIPIMLILILFRIKNLSLLNTLSSFASGSLIGDVFLHNVPELLANDSKLKISGIHNHYLKEFLKFLLEKDVLFCLGIISFFFIEKLIALITTDKKNTSTHDHNDNDHGHHHHHHSTANQKNLNIVICIIGDTLHNVTDGLALGAAYSKGLLLGITLTMSIFFHELPHELGDFSYLLKQNMSIKKAFSTQVLSAVGAFLGVYLSFIIGERYSDQILAFASGTFIYISVNTIMGDLKQTDSLFALIVDFIAVFLGVFMMYIFI